MGKVLLGVIAMALVSLTSVSAIYVPRPPVNVEIDPTARLLESSTVVPIARVNVYNPVPRQTDADPHISSCGPNRSNQIAVSRDLFFSSTGTKHLCGVRATLITKTGLIYHNYVIWDTLNPRYKNTVDVMLPHADEALAMQIGITTGTLILRY